MNSIRNTQRGQGMMEYIIIVAMIAVAAIGTYSLFGKTIRNQTAGMADELAGKKAATDKAIDSAALARGRAETTKGMSEYNVENDQK
ncbi:Flp family type IVb pilin [Rhodoferax sp.]|uniref:Flp family type IVb pilin n=1 Tax=Rhodoferax sp. TaxID=50421 RepID=UPI00276387E7|nr:pilus assembly protein [Rhodoferax sp.]